LPGGTEEGREEPVICMMNEKPPITSFPSSFLFLPPLSSLLHLKMEEPPLSGSFLRPPFFKF
jgi:hypothetical protein